MSDRLAENAEIRQGFRDAMPPMSDEDWALFCDRMAARMRGEPHVHTRLCACGEESTTAYLALLASHLPVDGPVDLPRNLVLGLIEVTQSAMEWRSASARLYTDAHGSDPTAEAEDRLRVAEDALRDALTDLAAPGGAA